MKIAVNIEAVGARYGGAENYAASLVRWLTSAGHQVHVVCREADPADLPRGTQVHRLSLPPWPGLGFLRSYRFARSSELLLGQQHFDLIIGLVKVWHQHVYIAVGGSHPASLAYNSLRFRNPLGRLLWWGTKLASPKQWVYRWIEHRQFSPGRSPHVIVPAQMVAEHFQKYHGVPPEKISIVPWGLDTSRELADRSTARAAFRRKHALAEGDVAILFVARNYQLKGLGPLLQAFAPLAKCYPHVRLLACGGKHEAAHQRQSQRLGITGQVHFLGYVNDIRNCFAGADVFAFPTFYDPCSLVVLEAMRAGLPVITTRANGAAELITDGSEGFIIDSPWSIYDLRLRLQLLATDAALRQRMGLQARSAAERFSLVDRAGQLLTCLERAAADSPASPAARAAA